MSDTHAPSLVHDGPFIVGIGASAGGLEALEKFFRHLPLNTGLAYVVLQHTSPDHTSLLSCLLRRVTDLPVLDAKHGVVAAANKIYVMPTCGALRVVRGRLHCRSASILGHAHHAIDDFLTSLAQDQTHRSVGVVLSGMGHDGTLGLQAIHHAKGLCLAQLPETAAFGSMPQGAIDAGCVDVVAAPQDMPERIVQWIRRAQTVTDVPLEALGEAHALPTDALESVVALLRQHLNHDFSHYKPSTLQRRVERRMHVHQLSTIADYVLYLRTSTQELDLLFSEMLIGVTSFFRDPQVWLDLALQVIPNLSKTSQSRPIRAWVLGCSTGEEAYSLAMVLRESQAGSARAPLAVQIYATDLNPTALQVARKAWYTEAALAGVSQSRRERFFTRHEDGFTVHPDIRAMVIFAQHDVIMDPPFTQLDLLVCRNLLIYFNAALQRRLMPLFHFCLRTGGNLVLGSAETVGRFSHLFTSQMPRSRIYGRIEQHPRPGSVVFPLHPRADARPHTQELTVSPPTVSPPHNLQALADQLLLQTFSPAAVLVNASGDILYTSGRTGQYLEPAAGKANWNIHVMVRPAMRAPIAKALRQALQTQQPVLLNGLPLTADGLQLQLTVHPLQEPAALLGLAMLIFKERGSLTARTEQVSAGAAPVTVHTELQSAHTEMNALQQEVLASKDQMHALYDALKLSNEELQSAHEEMTRAKEEAQSVNEELQTIYSELQTRLDDLAQAQSDMQNLLHSTDIATLFLDNDLRVRRYTEQAVGLFHLRESDVGRPLSDLANTLDYPLLLADVKDMLHTLSPRTKSVVSTDGRWFSVRIMPYRTLANMVNGAVLTFVDISMAKALEFRLRESNQPFQTSETST